MPKKYTDEFKKDAAGLVESGMSQKQVCADLGVSKSALQSWVAKAQYATHGLPTSGDAETMRASAQALKRIRELEMENEVLRRAAAYLSQANLKFPKMIYPLVQELAVTGTRLRVPVTVTCRVLKITKQGYFKWLAVGVSQRDWDDAHLANQAFDMHQEDPEYGYRQIAWELEATGATSASERRIWRVCSENGIRSVIVGTGRRTGSWGPPTAEAQVRRDFTADGPNQLWLTDITEHWTREGKLYLCTLKDVFSNRIVGYSIDSRMKASLAVAALTDAINRRSPAPGLIVHSDRGSQFRARKFRRVLDSNGLAQSMGAVGTCADNAAMESFFNLVQTNVLDRKKWATRQELRLALVRWINGTYNRRRRQRALGKLTPLEYEITYQPTAQAA
ncbi:IS3 family transposase [Pseudoclavibacter sp. 13-3]|uniref:IS3 family transposase n=1 Tax=Pseudoclavibacter sp. 13-3 TaxID=2901228 RepID=UPI001E4D323E|nr:IS3 family transposase [Pseudoclavibacter sp. 13-3]MCD7100547.1 IS3 family transposase [Pseudoclavibacter sp. 13-3]